MEKWVVCTKRADFVRIGEKFGIDQVTAKLIRNREVVGDEEIQLYLHGTRKDMYSPWLLKDMEKAVNILHQKISSGKKIRIIGDYDIDGIMSTYILYQGLTRAGARVDFVIPHRIRDGYGVNDHLIVQAKEDGIDTILTCDNGIAAGGQVEHGKSMGMTVIITDHHEVPFVMEEGRKKEILPPADCVINPKQAACAYPFSGLCGAGVALKLMQAYFERNFPETDILDELLEYAAVATVGDVMDLVGENRIIVKEGLKRLHHTKNLGLRALIQVNELEPEQVGSYHIGFVIGPCLNATGRLETARTALELLLSQREEKARELAQELYHLNTVRKEMTVQGVEKAIELVETTDLIRDKVLVVFLPDCHESLAGIIAGRLREKYYRPVFVLTRGEEGIKGSGRSIESYSMYEKMCECGELLTKFGGHPMAAGLSLEEENIEPFRKKINELSGLTEEDLMEKITIDVPMPLRYVRKDLVEEMHMLEPFGKGNEKPVFAQSGLRILSKRILGKNRNVVKLRIGDGEGYIMDGIYFGDADEFLEGISGKEEISLLYYPEINSYMGRESLQAVIKGYR